MKRILLALSATLLFSAVDTNAMRKLVASASLQAARQTPRRHLHAAHMPQGPVMASALYWITKVSCWTGVSLAGSAVVVGAVASATVTGGTSVAVPLAVAGGGTGGIGLGIGATAKIMGVGAAKATGTGLVKMAVGTAITTGATGGGGLIVAPLTVTALTGAIEAAPAVAAAIMPAAKAGTVVLASGSAGGLGIAAGIESASCGAYALGMLFPWF